MTKILSDLNGIVWGVPALVLILGVGMYLSLRLGFVQLTLFPRAARVPFSGCGSAGSWAWLPSLPR